MMLSFNSEVNINCLQNSQLTSILIQLMFHTRLLFIIWVVLHHYCLYNLHKFCQTIKTSDVQKFIFQTFWRIKCAMLEFYDYFLWFFKEEIFSSKHFKCLSILLHYICLMKLGLCYFIFKKQITETDIISNVQKNINQCLSKFTLKTKISFKHIHLNIIILKL